MQRFACGLAAGASLLLLAGSAASLSLNNGWCTIPTRPGAPYQGCQFSPSPDKPVGAVCYCGSKKGKVANAGTPPLSVNLPPEEPEEVCTVDPRGLKTCRSASSSRAGPRSDD